MDTEETHNCKVDIEILLAWANMWISKHKFCSDSYVLASLARRQMSLLTEGRLIRVLCLLEITQCVQNTAAAGLST